MALTMVITDEQGEADGQHARFGVAEVRKVILDAVAGKLTKATIRNCTIAGELNFESANIDLIVKFADCVFEGRVRLEQAKLKAAYFVNCALRGISADELQTTFSFVVRDCEDTGGIVLTGAHIAGQLEFDGSTLKPPEGRALTADGIVVDQDFRCSTNFSAMACVRMIGAHIGGQFVCSDNSRFDSPGDKALQASGSTIAEHMFLSDGFESRGGVDLTGCHIGGNLDISKSAFHQRGRPPALDLARAVIDQNMVCENGSSIDGQMLLAGAKIGGSLWCAGGRFDNVNGIAIEATGLTIGRDAVFGRAPGNGGFLAQGEVVLDDAIISGSLLCTGGEFRNPGRVALAAKGINVTRDAAFRAAFTTDGEIDLSAASIGGNLDCTGGWFGNPAMSIRCDWAIIKQSAKFGTGCYAAGEVSLAGAQITADLTFTGVTLGATSPANALTLRNTSVTGQLGIHLATRPAAAIDLRWAKAGQLDDQNAHWPDLVLLEGFVYQTIPSDAQDPQVKERLGWLAKNGRYVPQIYLQLATVYQAAGSDDESTRVAIAGQDARRKSQNTIGGRFKGFFWLLLKLTVRYGYRPLQILWWLIGLEVIGSVVFLILNNLHQFKPSSATVPDFNSILYTLDLLIPVASLGEHTYWVPTGAAQWVAALFTVLGWILAACLVVGVGKIFKSQ